MLRCYCPECGQRIGGIGSAKHRGQNDKYCVSISGLFKNIETDEVLLETALSKKLSIDFGKIAACTSLRILSEKVEEDNQADGMSYGDSEEFYSIIDNANKLHFRQIGMDLDDPDEYVARLNQYNYVWIRLLLEKLSIQVNRHNRVLDYLFSVVNPDENKNWLSFNMKAAFNQERLKEIYDTMSTLIEQHQREQFQQDMQASEEIVNIINTASDCWLMLDKNSCQCDVTTGNDSKKYITNITYGRKFAYKRICPFCGAHISAYLGLYDQKIISFIGTPTSGKSTFINAVFAKIKQTSHQLKGITIEFDRRDPFSIEYEKNSQKMGNKLAVDKTNKGVYPVLTVLIKAKNAKNSFVYTFVDVPGEYFSNANNDEFYFNRIKIMAHSDIVCMVLAGEQLMGIRPHGENIPQETVADIGDSTITNFMQQCINFRGIILNKHKDERYEDEKRNMEVVLMVTKVDALKPDPDLDYHIINGERFLKLNTNISESSVNEFFTWLKKDDSAFYDESTHTVRKDALEELMRYAHIFVKANENRADSVITDLIRTFSDNTLDEIPVFFVSSYGFYAITTIWNLSENEKVEALSNAKNLTEENCRDIAAQIVNVGNEPIQNNWLKTIGYTQQQILDIYTEYYRNKHTDDISLGVNSFLYYVLDKTGIFTNEKLKRSAELKLDLEAAQKKLAEKQNEREEIGAIHFIKKRSIENEISDLTIRVNSLKKSLIKLEE